MWLYITKSAAVDGTEFDMKRVLLRVAYDGTKYHGWQIQPNALSVCEVVNKALSDLLKEPIEVMGASRTDAGVHALGNVAVFDTHTLIPSEKISYALNQRLPEDIVIRESRDVPDEFHPRFVDSIKTYQYTIQNSTFPLPTNRLYSYFVHYPLDVDKMKEGAKYLVGTHDFKGFCSSKTQVTDTGRTIYGIKVEQDFETIKITVSGNGFLYNMVRIIAGTLIKVGLSQYEPEYIKEMIEKKDRSIAGPTAPACGLMLVKIEYPDLEMK